MMDLAPLDELLNHRPPDGALVKPSNQNCDIADPSL